MEGGVTYIRTSWVVGRGRSCVVGRGRFFTLALLGSHARRGAPLGPGMLTETTVDLSWPALSTRTTCPRAKVWLTKAGCAPGERGFTPHPIETVSIPQCASSLDQGTRPRWASHCHPPSWLSPAHFPACSRPLQRPQCHGCHSTSPLSTTTEVPARAHIARARLGLVLKRCLQVPCM